MNENEIEWKTGKNNLWVITSVFSQLLLDIYYSLVLCAMHIQAGTGFIAESIVSGLWRLQTHNF